MKKQNNRQEAEPIDVNNDQQMVREGLRYPLIKVSDYDIKNKNVGLNESQKENIPNLGISLTPKTRERDVLRILRKRKEFKSVFQFTDLHEPRFNVTIKPL